MRFKMVFLACAITVQPAMAAETSKEKVYSAAPASLEAPASTSIADIRAASGNLDRWAKAERLRLGPCETIEAFKTRIDEWTASAKASKMPDKQYWRDYPKRNCPAIANVEGFFLLSSGDPAALIKPGAVVAATWNGAETLTLGRFVPIEGFCAENISSAPRPLLSTDSFIYLGAEWSDAWSGVVREWTGGQPASATAIHLDITKSQAKKTAEKFYPTRALDREKSGDATVVCTIEDDATKTCALASETPTGWDFGEAAMKIVSSFTITLNGASPGRCIAMPINFSVGP